MVFILSALWHKDKRFMGTSWWRKLGLVLMDGAMLNKSLIQFSTDGWGCVPSLLFDLRPNCGRGNEDNGDFLQKDLCPHCCIQCPWPHGKPLSTYASAGDYWTLTGKFGAISCGVTAVFSKSLFPQSCVSSLIKSHWPPKWNSLGVLSPFARSPHWEICCGSYNFLNSVKIYLV